MCLRIVATMATHTNSHILSEDDLYGYLGETVPRRTLGQWRYRGLGPPYAKIGRHVVYRREDVDRWLAEHTKNADVSS